MWLLQGSQVQQPPSVPAASLGSEQAKPAPRPLSAGGVPLDLAQAQAQAQAQARRPPMQGMPPPQQQQQARGMPQQYGGMPKPGFAPHQRPYGETLSLDSSLSAFPHTCFVCFLGVQWAGSNPCASICCCEKVGHAPHHDVLCCSL